jgi:hypothetical protein
MYNVRNIAKSHRYFRQNQGRSIMPLVVGIGWAHAIASMVSVAHADQYEYNWIASVGTNSVVLEHHHVESNTVPLPNLIIMPDAQAMLDKEGDDAKTVANQADVAPLLLREGVAKLRDFEHADKSLRDIQTKATQMHVGMWALPPTSPAPKPDKTATTGSDVGPGFYSTLLDKVEASGMYLAQEVFEYWKEAIALGLFGGFVVPLYRILRIERRLKLTLIGQASSGKTGVFLRLTDTEHEIHEADIMSLSTSLSVAKKTIPKPFPLGRYEVKVAMSDIPGLQFGAVIDALGLRRFVSKHVLMLVVAPIRPNALLNDQWIDARYVERQLGYAEGLVIGAIESKSRKEISLIVIFINKFDLISSTPPGDSASVQAEEQILQPFAKFVEMLQERARMAGVEVAVIIGSAVKGWNIAAVKRQIEARLYADK